MLDAHSRGDGSGRLHPLAGLVRCMDCGSTMSKTSNGRKNGARVEYLRCKLYADSGTQKLCTRHSIRLDALIALVTERLRAYIGAYYRPEELDLPEPKDTRRELLTQERGALTAQAENGAPRSEASILIRCPVL